MRPARLHDWSPLLDTDEKSLLQVVATAVYICISGLHGIPIPDYSEENVSTNVVRSI